MTPPRTFSHIGLSVPDLDAAVKFYSEVLGFYVVMQPTEAVEEDTAIGVMCTDVFGPDWKSLKIAHLATADRVGIEIFEFPENYAPDDNLDHKRHGTFHFCVQDPDVEGLVEKIVAAGGRVLGVTALGQDLQAARDLAYEAAAIIQFEGAFTRTDIAAKGL